MVSFGNYSKVNGFFIPSICFKPVKVAENLNQVTAAKVLITASDLFFLYLIFN